MGVKTQTKREATMYRMGARFETARPTSAYESLNWDPQRKRVNSAESAVSFEQRGELATGLNRYRWDCQHKAHTATFKRVSRRRAHVTLYTSRGTVCHVASVRNAADAERYVSSFEAHIALLLEDN